MTLRVKGKEAKVSSAVSREVSFVSYRNRRVW